MWVVVKLSHMLAEFSVAYSYFSASADLFARAAFSISFGGDIIKPSEYYGALVIIAICILPLVQKVLLHFIIIFVLPSIPT